MSDGTKRRGWVRPVVAGLIISGLVGLLFLLTRLTVSVDADALRAPLLLEVSGSARLADVCPGGAAGLDFQLSSITAQRSLVGDEGSGSAIVVVPTSPPCRARVDFWLRHDSGPRRDTTERGAYRVRVTEVRSVPP